MGQESRRQPKLHIKLLGDFRVALDDEPITALNTSRLQALIAYLLLHGDTLQSRQHIAFLFWPDSPETQAYTNLRNLIVTLRKAFPSVEQFVSISRQDMRWRSDSPFSLDVAEFERALSRARDALDSDDPLEELQRAADLYNGDLLPGCYDEWILGPREQLRDQYQWVLEQLVRACQSSQSSMYYSLWQPVEPVEPAELHPAPAARSMERPHAPRT